MNKILIGKKIISDTDGVKVSKNVITFIESGEYVIEYTDSGDYNVVFEIHNDIKLIESSFDNSLNLDNHYIINKGSLSVIKFYNNKEVIEKINIDLCSDGSKVDYKFSNICKGIENYQININHKFMNTTSNICNRSVALKNSKINFVINSNVLSDGINSILNQNTRIVVMDECDAKVCPNMFIDLVDVEARHGSIIVKFKEEDIFYLMSKGISYNDTLKLLIKGYLFSNIDGHIDLRKRISDIINLYWR